MERSQDVARTEVEAHNQANQPDKPKAGEGGA